MGNSLENAFNIDIIPAESTKIQTVVLEQAEGETQEDGDAKYTRQNQIDLIELSKAAVQTAMKIAVESEHPKSIESLALMIKTASEVNRQLYLQRLDKAKVDLTKGATGQPPVGNTTNVLVTGSLSEVLAQIRKGGE